MTKKWWKESIGYQIYPKSFMDSNGDGIGDLVGITSKLDYLRDLGIDLVWISPIFKSPQVDHGYDVSDYEDIDEMYGSKEQLKTLINEAKKRNIKIILDLVVNHTSDKHHWFQKALKNPESEYGKYYIFRRGTKDTPPNNWRGIFNGSAWEKVGGKDSDLYYLHLFTKEQPDLNWENPKLRREIYDMVNRWLDFGIDGFRVDAISHIKKDFTYKNIDVGRADGLYDKFDYYNNCAGIEDFLQEMKRETFSKYDCFTVGEVSFSTIKTLAEYAGVNGHFSSLFDFCHNQMNTNTSDMTQEEFIENLKTKIFEVQNNIDSETTLTHITENHDLCRNYERFIPKEDHNFYSKTLTGTFNFFMRGIPFIYQGQEIGMSNYVKKDISEFADPVTERKYSEMLAVGKSEKEAFDFTNFTSREHTRTPIQWNSSKNAGFTTGEPWFAVNPNYTEINVEDQLKDANSVINYYKNMIKVRRKYSEVFSYGHFKSLFEDVKGLLAYKRGDEIYVYNNFTPNEMTVKGDINKVILSNYSNTSHTKHEITLKPYQTLVFK